MTDYLQEAVASVAVIGSAILVNNVETYRSSQKENWLIEGLEKFSHKNSIPP